jgi:Mg2+-importing ATPase
MFFIGHVSSIFDFMTFGVMLYIFKAGPELFHTGWFVESLITQTVVIYVIRTTKIPIFESRPSKFLVFTSLAIMAVGLIMPFTPMASWFGFVKPSAKYFLILEAMVAAYLFLVYFVQKLYIKRFGKE